MNSECKNSSKDDISFPFQDSTEHNYNKTIINGAIFNIFGWIWPILLSFISTKYIISRLGVDSYGVYSLLGLVFGYLSSLIAPISQANIKYLAELFNQRSWDKSYEIISASLLLQSIIGALAGLLLFCGSNWLSINFFQIPKQEIPVAQLMFKIGGFGFFINSILSVMSSIPTSLQRYDLLNIINALLGTLSTVLIVTTLFLGHGLREIIFISPIISIFGIWLFFVVCKKQLPSINLFTKFSFNQIKNLLGYSFWVLINQIASILTFQVGRTIIGASLGTSALTYFTIPNNLSSYVQSFATSLSMSFFPISSELIAKKAYERLHELYIKAFRISLFLCGGLTVFLIGFGPLLLSLWLGENFAEKSSIALSWLAIWGFCHAIGALPYYVSCGGGHPEIPAIFSIFFGLSNLIFTIAFLPKLGVNGAAFGAALSTIIISPIFIGYIQSKVLKIDNILFLKKYIVPFLLISIILVPISRYSLNILKSTFLSICSVFVIGLLYFFLCLIFKIIDVSMVSELSSKIIKKNIYEK